MQGCWCRLLLGVRNATLGPDTLVETAVYVLPKGSDLNFSLCSWSHHWVRECVVIIGTFESGGWPPPLLSMFNTHGQVRLCFPKPRDERHRT